MATAPRFAPEFRVRINDRDIPAALRGSITSVRYEDGMNAADRVEVGIANIDLRWLQRHIRGLGFRPFPTAVDVGPFRTPGPEGLFDVDNTLSLAVGYAPDPLEEMFVGEITGVQADFPTGGVPTMALVAHDRLHRLTQGKAARGFGPLPDALIAAILAAENRLIPTIDPAVSGASTAIAVVNHIFGGTGRKQRGQSDLELLQEIATDYDADFWVDGDVLFFSRFLPKEYTPRLTLTWGESLLQFSPQVSMVGQIVSVTMKFTLREIPLAFLVTVFWDFDREALGIRVLPAAAAPTLREAEGPTFMIADHAIRTPADLVNSALSAARELRNRLNSRLTGSGSAVGDPRIRAGAVIRLEGLGPNFSGDYRVASAVHSLDTGGYRTTFQVRKEIIP